MDENLKAISLRIPDRLLKEVTKAARDSHMDRSNWIRLAMSEKLGVGSSHDSKLLDQVEVVDERAREIVKDLVRRVALLEAQLQGPRGSQDPFRSLYERIDDLAEPMTSEPDPTKEEAIAMLQGPEWLLKKAKGENPPGPYTELVDRYLKGEFIFPTRYPS